MVAEDQSSAGGADGGSGVRAAEGAPRRRSSFMPSQEQMAAMRERASSAFGRKKGSAVLREFHEKTGGMYVEICSFAVDGLTTT